MLKPSRASARPKASAAVGVAVAVAWAAVETPAALVVDRVVAEIAEVAMAAVVVVDVAVSADQRFIAA